MDNWINGYWIFNPLIPIIKLILFIYMLFYIWMRVLRMLVMYCPDAISLETPVSFCFVWNKVPRFRLFLWRFNVVNVLVFLGKVWGGIWSGCWNSSYKQHTQEFRSVASRQHPWQGTQQTKWGIKSCSTSQMCFQPTGMGSAERAIGHTRTVQELYSYVKRRWARQLLSHIFRIIHCKT